MNQDELRQYLNGKKAVTEELPFGPEVVVFKVMGKMFVLFAWTDTPIRINLKCDPERALALRATYPSILPGYHMNKKHWNTLILDGSIPQGEVLAMIDDSYNLVVKGLKKADREKLAGSSDC